MSLNHLSFKIVVALLLGISFSLKGQGNRDNDGGDTSNDPTSFEVPTITPVSPEAGSLGQFGAVPVNGSTGQMSFQIPIHTIEVSDYSWPISLNYSYGGLILEAKPSISGLGWLLSGGGVVTREIRSVPDHHPVRGLWGQVYAESNYEEVVGKISNNQPVHYQILTEAANGQLDTELDKFTVSVGGINFSFKIDVDGNPVFLSEHNYQVSWTHQISNIDGHFYGQIQEIAGFEVTDDRGIIYRFNDIEKNVPDYDDYIYNEVEMLGYYSSWQLSEIIFPSGGTVHFNYQDDSYLNYSHSASGYTSEGVDHTNPLFLLPGSCQSLQSPEQGYDESISRTIIHRKLLSNISFPYGSIDLNIIEHDNRKLYNRVDLKYNDGTVVDHYDLTHLGPRDALTKVNKNDDFHYEFTYHSAATLPRFLNSINDRPMAQDYWGFFNNTSNSHMVHIPNTSINSNKNPNFFGARQGAMTRISYPTGGYSDITYEPNDIAVLIDDVDTDQNHSYNRRIRLQAESDDEFNAPPTKSVTFEYTFEEPVVALVSHQIRGFGIASHISASITPLTCTPTCPNGCASPWYPVVAQQWRAFDPFTLPDVCLSAFEAIDPAGEGPDENGMVVREGHSGGRIRITPGTYRFEITIHRNNQIDLAHSDGFIQILFHEPQEAQDQNGATYTNVVTGGIRVASIVSQDNNGQPTKKYYDYNVDGLSSAIQLAIGQDSYSQEVLFDCEVVGPDPTGIFNDRYRIGYYRNIYSSRYYNPVNINSGIPVYYQSVREYSTIELVEVELEPGSQIQVHDHPSDKNPDGTLIYSVFPPNTNNDNPVTPTLYNTYYTDGSKVTNFAIPGINFAQQNYPFVPMGDDLNKGRLKSETLYEFKQADSTRFTRQHTNLTYHAKTVSPFHENHPKSVKMGVKRVYRRNQGIFGSLTILTDWVEPDPNGNNLWDYFHVPVYRESDKYYTVKNTTTTSYFEEGTEMVKSTENVYDDHWQVKESITEDSEGKIVTQKFYYPYDIAEDIHTAMINKNQLAKPVQIEILENDDLISSRKNVYGAHGNDFKLMKIQVAKGNNPFEDRLQYSYISNGRVRNHHEPATVVEDTDVPTEIPTYNNVTYIWGYGRKYPVAKIEGATQSEVSSIDIGDVQNLDGQALRDALNQLRVQLPKSQVTTYTYQPLVGVTSSTDPKGYTMYYEYDHLHRLVKVTDQNGKIYSTHEYNYATSN